ncbi:MAG: hypothetical protein AAFX80_00280 [Cyanobacteria bacterium J06639_18]
MDAFPDKASLEQMLPFKLDKKLVKNSHDDPRI